jgi:hypothetical protein
MARLYANENFPLPVVEKLRAAGHDVVTVAETGKAEQAWPDEDVRICGARRSGNSHFKSEAFYPIAP